ncbi:MAG: VWA domain-containing protein [Fimbriiglobus sp.]
MTFVKRLRLLTAIFGVSTASLAVGMSVYADLKDRNQPLAAKPKSDTVQAATEAARTKFSALPTVTYRNTTGETLFAWQIRPELVAQAGRPRDIAVMIDTSASQAGPWMQRARAILDSLSKNLGSEDRVTVWTINTNNAATTRSLTNGFVAPESDAMKSAISVLTNKEYGSGAVDLPAGIEAAAKTFDQRPGRQQVLLYLGDGESAASKAPLTENNRVELGQKLADREIAFFAVPLGIKIQAENLHGLAMLTGGCLVRISDDLTTNDFTKKLKTAIDAPILRTDRVTFGPEGMELYPTRLPPLRSDRSTLVLGKTKATVQTISARIEGRVGTTKTTIDLSDKLADPSTDHYFLPAMIDQYRNTTAKASPVMLSSDRTLAMASEQYRLFRDEFTIQGVWAISADRVDHAEKLFQAALNIDPQSKEAASGMNIVSGLRGGKLKADGVKMGLAQGVSMTRLQEPGAEPKKEGAKPLPAPTAGGATPAEKSLIEQAKNAQAVLEQEYRILVDETLRRARRLMTSDPDSAYEDLKRQRESVLGNEQLSETTRQKLSNDLESAMREVTLKGSEIKRTLSSQRERIAQARQRINEFEQKATQEEQTRARIDSFRQLMNQARFELAQQEAQVMIAERVSRGQNIPPEALAAYRISQSANNLRELTELKRIRENNYLLTMLQVEKSFVPYPDEPPVHFPPAAVWRELTGSRVEKYSNANLGPDAPPSFKRLRAVIEGETSKRIKINSLDGLTLSALLATISKEFEDDGVKFVFRQELFPADFKPGEEKIKTTSDLAGLPLGTFLDTILRDLKMSWVARPEYIEIGPNTTEYSLRYEEKVTRVFDVAELIVGIPNAQSTSALIQNLQFLGAQATIFGTTLQPISGLGAGGLGLGGLGVGGLGVGGLGVGGLGAGGLGAGGLGAGLGAGGLGAGLGAAGGQPGGQQGIAGAGGGAGGGNQGQLGSAFSIQGNDQSATLVQLITSVVARGEWDLAGIGGLSPSELSAAFGNNQEPPASVTDARKLNSIGFYPPARALIIRGSHRYHASPSFRLKVEGGMAQGGPGLPRNGDVIAEIGGNGNVANAVPNTKEATRAVATALANKNTKDPEKLWNVFLAKVITQPDVVIDAADVLFDMKEFGHATEVLKASLRQGRVNGIWTHDALAIALQSNQGTAAEVERASLSSIDMDPTSSSNYLQAAKAESQLGNHEIALAYCQRAAHLEPNSPNAYANALVYADRVTDVKSDAIHWAATNLLKRDWGMDEINYHAETKQRVSTMATKLTGQGRQAEATRLAALTVDNKNRDIVIELLYQGRADLDLSVVEPNGSICSATHKRTTAGGLLKSDIMEQRDEDRSEVYTAAEAFPGQYKIQVRSVLGTPINNRARIKVTKNIGTPEQSVEVFSLDLSKETSVSVTLNQGSRKELASMPDQSRETQMDSTQSIDSVNRGSFSAGFGDRFTSESSLKSALPTVKPTVESRLTGISEGQPGMRFEAKLAPDRKNVVMSAKPVFTGTAVNIPMPRINLLPQSAE